MALSDAAFAIGAAHRVCQDYGLAGRLPSARGPDHGFALGADGCSSSPDTDFGARLLCRAAARALTGPDLDAVRAVETAARWARLMGLPAEAVDATLLAVVETPGGAEARVFGDGVIAARRRDGSGCDHWVIEVSGNAPAYPSYALEPDRMQAHLRKTEAARRVTHRSAEGACETVEGSAWTHSGAEAPRSPRPVCVTLERSQYDVVAVISDGVLSFERSAGAEAVPVPEVLAELMAFKTLTPGFAQRRVRRFVGRECPRRGWRHADDLVVAAVALEPPGGLEP